MVTYPPFLLNLMDDDAISHALSPSVSMGAASTSDILTIRGQIRTYQFIAGILFNAELVNAPRDIGLGGVELRILKGSGNSSQVFPTLGTNQNYFGSSAETSAYAGRNQKSAVWMPVWIPIIGEQTVIARVFNGHTSTILASVDLMIVKRTSLQKAEDIESP